MLEMSSGAAPLGAFSLFAFSLGSKPQAPSVDDWLDSVLSLSPVVGLVVGIVFTVVGSCLMSVGSVLMKIGIQRDAIQFTDRGGSFPLCQPFWWLGFSIYTFGAVLHALALAYAPASILAPMNSLGLVANAAVAATVLSEPFGFRELVGTTGTVLGVALCAISTFLPHDETRITSGLESWIDPWYLVYVGTCCALSIGALVVVNAEEMHISDLKWDYYFNQHIARGHMEDIELTATKHHMPTGANGRSKSSKKKRVAIDDESASFIAQSERDEVTRPVIPQYPARLGMLYGVLAALVGAQCVLELKEFCACVKLIVAGEQTWASPLLYASATLCLLAIFLQIHFLNLGLSRGDATLVVPTYYVAWTIFGTLGGFSKFHECVGFSYFQIVLFIVGLVVTLCCIAFMAVREVEQNVLRELYETSPPVLIGSELEDGQAVHSSLRRFQMNVPLTFGYGLLPLGSLGGRLKMGAHPAVSRLRRVRSHDGLPVSAALADGAVAGRHAPSPLLDSGTSHHYLGEGRQRQDAPYNWTVAAASNWHMTEPKTPLSFNQSFLPPTVDDLYPPNFLEPQRSSSNASRPLPQSGLRVSPLQSAAGRPQKQRRRGLNEIVYADEVV